MTPINSPHQNTDPFHAELEEDEQIDNQLAIEASLTATPEAVSVATGAITTTSEPSEAETTTTTTEANLQPTNHQRQASPEVEEEDDEASRESAHHHLRQTQNFPERITEAQLDRLNKLIKIIRQGSYNEFTELLAERTFKNLLNVFVDGHTALHYSLIYGRSLAWCKQLVSNGANPNLTNRSGWHPIHLAAFSGSRETMRFLIDCIAN